MERNDYFKRLRMTVTKTTSEDMDGNIYYVIYLLWNDKTWEKGALLSADAFREFQEDSNLIENCSRGFLIGALRLLKDKYPDIIVWMK